MKGPDCNTEVLAVALSDSHAGRQLSLKLGAGLAALDVTLTSSLSCSIGLNPSGDAWVCAMSGSKRTLGGVLQISVRCCRAWHAFLVRSCLIFLASCKTYQMAFLHLALLSGGGGFSKRVLCVSSYALRLQPLRDTDIVAFWFRFRNTKLILSCWEREQQDRILVGTTVRQIKEAGGMRSTVRNGGGMEIADANQEAQAQTEAEGKAMETSGVERRKPGNFRGRKEEAWELQG
eukprot:768434-Hanusia_phi.AAC.1